jgi:hypothetical protein
LIGVRCACTSTSSSTEARHPRPKDFEPDDTDTKKRGDLCLVGVPLTEIVRDAGGIKIMRNVAALGATLGLMDLPLDGLLDSIKSQFAHKAPEIAEQNIAVATAGYEHAREVTCEFPASLDPVSDAAPRVLVDGNEAIGLGALAAGIGLYCAYPMTPASSLLHFMARHGEGDGVVVKHTEDEIAAMNMVVGGPFAGTRSMCATSGGGFRWSRPDGLAVIAERRVRRRAIHATDPPPVFPRGRSRAICDPPCTRRKVSSRVSFWHRATTPRRSSSRGRHSTSPTRSRPR